MTYRQVADHVKQRQRLRHQKMTKPDDDWFPEAYFLRATGRLSHQDIPTPWFHNRTSKEALVNDVFVPLIRWGGVRVFAFVVVMYMLEPEHPVTALIAERDKQGWESPTKGLPPFLDARLARVEDRLTGIETKVAKLEERMEHA